jgi:hypothetical protein
MRNKRGTGYVEEQAHAGADDVLGDPPLALTSSSTTELIVSYVNESRGQVLRGDDKIHTVEPLTAEN